MVVTSMIGSKREAPGLALEYLEEPSKRLCLNHVDDGAQQQKVVSPQDDEHEASSSEDEDSFDQVSTPATSTATGAATPKNPPREKRFRCDYPDCGKAFTRPVRLAEHQRSHNNERPFICARDGCSKAFLRESHLKHHVKSQHDNIRNYTCDWSDCGKAFVTGSRMRAHRKTHTETTTFQCSGYPPCELQFRKVERLRQHIMRDHLDEALFVCEEPDRTTGIVCGKSFKHSWGLTVHRKEHHSGKTYVCELCLGVETEGVDSTEPTHQFQSYSELTKHVREVHPPTCELCRHPFQTASQLRAHVDVHHQGDVLERRTVPCTEPGCERMFTKKGNMLVHVKSAHRRERFVCGDMAVLSGCKDVVFPSEWVGSNVDGSGGGGGCGRDFASKATLIKHIRSKHLHLPAAPTGEQRGQDGCIGKGKQKRKERKARMVAEQPIKKHPRSVQDEEEEEEELSCNTLALLTGEGYEASRPLPCALKQEQGCLQRFRRGYDLTLHLERHHGLCDRSEARALADAVCERVANTGGVFWIGGRGKDGEVYDEVYDDAGNVGANVDANVDYDDDALMEDVELAGRLRLALGDENGDGDAGCMDERW